MPWKETCPVDEKMVLVAEFLKGTWTISELCRSFGISRKTGYKWIERYKRGGPGALSERSRAPHRCPHSLSDESAQMILAARKEHPTWGPRKILAWISRKNPRMQLPAASTAGDLLKRYGLTQPRRRRRRTSRFRQPLQACLRPNDTWCADFKGHFRMGDGRKCYPLTLSDAYSRFLLACRGLLDPNTEETKKRFEIAFKEFGLPHAIRSDNGSPFATIGPQGLSKLSIWWLKLRIRHERIQPGRPDQNGSHERMHRTLKQEATKPPKAALQAQQYAFDRFRDEYNFERPHEALDQSPPASWYRCSPRQYPQILPEFSYPRDATRRIVHESGRIRWKGH
jgi:transposase InsO family protein